MMLLRKFPFTRQHDKMDCGPACLKMIARYYKRRLSLGSLRQLSHTGRQGTDMLSLAEAARAVGFETDALKLGFSELEETFQHPCIAYWQQRHFVVIYKISGEKIYVSDPAYGRIVYSKKEFCQHWICENGKGIVLMLQPTGKINLQASTDDAFTGFAFIAAYIKQHKTLMWKAGFFLVAGSFLQFIFPMLTQNLVDKGIGNKDMPLIHLILLGQLFLFMGRMVMELARNHILLHLSNRLSIDMLSNFFQKLMRLPISFFDTKFTGDILQRISDHGRVEQFITTGAMQSLFSLLSMLVLGAVLFWFSPVICGLFVLCTIVYIIWVQLFMKQRATLDYKRFSQLAQNQEKNIEIITGMPDIKLHGAEAHIHGQWKTMQMKQYELNLKSMTLAQWQTGGAAIINEMKNILITFFAATAVVQNQLSLGSMLSITYIIGQLNVPLLQLVDFFKNWQDAKLSMNRLQDVYAKPDEDGGNVKRLEKGIICNEYDIKISNLYFKYDKSRASPWVLNNLNLVIPKGKVTAIVGSSGSGKTTLMKILLKFYDPDKGAIKKGSVVLSQLSAGDWRSRCGAVMQEGFIFNDTVAANIAVGEKTPYPERLFVAAKMANMHEFIAGLPLQYATRIGQNGLGLSAGQKQRVLIARAIYKDPDFIFFDEATSALDAQNERTIVENLEARLHGKTVVVIAHRLSTVKNADHIIVLEEGRVAEMGNHAQLVNNRGSYFNLVSNQLELAE